MLISEAYATTASTTSPAAPLPGAAGPGQPDAWGAFAWNMGLVVILVIMFYVLMIMPQQRRFKEHKAMQSALKKGDKVLTAAGFIGTVDKIVDDLEVIVDLGNGLKVTALRSTISSRVDDATLLSRKDEEKKK